MCAVSALVYYVRHVTNVFNITATLVAVLLSGFALPHHHPNHNSQQCVGWRQTSRQHTAGNIGLIPVLELGLGLSAVEALHALSIAVACIRSASQTQRTREQQTCECNSARSAMDRFVARVHCSRSFSYS